MGALINLFVVDRWQSWKAIIATTILAIAVLGIACDMLCLALDRRFLYFGGAEDSLLFLRGGFLMAALGGLIAGWLIFTERGQQVLNRLGL